MESERNNNGCKTCIHDLSRPFSFLARLRSQGLDNYPSRSLVCPGTTVTGADTQMSELDIKANYRLLRRIGVGADELIIVPGNDLQQGLLKNPDLLRRVRRAIFERGRPLSLYLSRGMDPIVAALGLRWEDTDAADWNVARMFDDKHNCRVLGVKLDAGRAFAPWEFIKGKGSDIQKAREDVLRAASWRVPTGVVFLKRPDYDGGEGIMQLRKNTREEDLSAYLERHLEHGILMEAGYPSDLFRTKEASLQVEIRNRGWRVLYPTFQLTRGDAHSGNELVVGDSLFEDRVMARITQCVVPFCREAVRVGYGKGRGRNMGFDFLIVTHEGETHVFLSEINARNTAPMYAKALADQAAPRFNGQCAVIMENRGITQGQTHYSLEAQLDGLLWDGTARPGILLGNAGCIAHGKVTMYFVAGDLAAARELRSRIPEL